MAKVPAGNVKVGMVVRAPITDRHGRRLIGEGTELTERHINALEMWGVPFVDIEGDEPECALDAVSPEAIESARRELDQIFALTDKTHPLTEALFDIALARRTQKHASHLKNGAAHG